MSEHIVIVDESDNVIGHKERTEIDDQHDTYRVSSVWVFNSKHEILIAQRKLTKKKDPSLWGPSVAGTVEAGESYEKNAYKETAEELGITDVLLVPFKKIHNLQPYKYFCQSFFGKT